MAEVALIGALGGPIFNLLLANLVSPAIEEIKREFGFEKLLNKLQDSATVIKRFLSDAQKKQVGEDAVKEWLKQLEAPASKANAIIEKFKRKNEIFQQEKKNKVTFCCFSVKFHISKAKFAREIEKVLESFDVINNRATGLGLQMQLANASSITLTPIEPQTELSPVESNIVSSTSVSEIVEIPDTAPPESTVSATYNYNMNHTELEILNLERVRDHIHEAIHACLFGKPNIVKLVMKWNRSREGQTNDQDVLEAFQPHSNLESFQIFGYKGRNFPGWAVLLTNSTNINIENCSQCKEIPGLGSFPNLEKLSLVSCASLITITGLDTLKNLKRMKILRCEELKSVSYVRGQSEGLKSLREMKIGDCKRLAYLPCELLESCFSSLESLSIYQLGRLENFNELGPIISKMSNLRELRFYKLSRLEGFPIDFICLKSLTKLAIGVFSETSDVESLNNYLNCVLETHSAYLRHLELVAETKWDSLPDKIMSLTSLDVLELREFKFEALPDWLGEMYWLEDMWITDCVNLRCMPSMEAMHLHHVDFENCPRLEERCSQRQSNSDDSERLKLSNIKRVIFNGYEQHCGEYHSRA